MKTLTEETLAPEGGWGWIASLGVALTFISTIGPYQTFGILYKAKVESFGEGTQALTLLASVNTSVSCLTGVLTNYALTRYSCRQVGIVGSFVFFIGGIWVAFCKSTLELVVAFGIMQGFGIGLMFPASFTTINHYFVKRRTFVTGITQLLIGIGCMGMPPIIELCFQKYGFFGAQMIVSGIGFHTLLSAIVQQPVHLHMKTRKTTTTYVFKENDGNGTVTEFAVVPQCDTTHETDLQNAKELRKFETSPLKEVRKYNILRKGWLTLVNFMDLRLMLDAVYMNITVGIAFSFFVDITASTLLSLIILDLHYTTGDTALFLSVHAAADIAGRLCIACIGAIYPRVSSRKLVFTGVLFSLIIRTILVQVEDFISLIPVVALMGYFRSFVQVPMHLTIAEHAKERFPAAYGLSMVMGGIVCLVGGPLIGWIRDFTNSYSLCMYTLNGIQCVCCVIPWSIEFILRRK